MEVQSYIMPANQRVRIIISLMVLPIMKIMLMLSILGVIVPTFVTEYEAKMEELQKERVIKWTTKEKARLTVFFTHWMQLTTIITLSLVDYHQWIKLLLSSPILEWPGEYYHHLDRILVGYTGVVLVYGFIFLSELLPVLDDSMHSTFLLMTFATSVMLLEILTSHFSSTFYDILTVANSNLALENNSSPSDRDGKVVKGESKNIVKIN